MDLNQETYHHVSPSHTFVKVLLPLAIPKIYTYQVPENLIPRVQFGVRVEVQFGKSKLYTGLICEIFTQPEKPQQIKEVISVMDDFPIISTLQINFWQWISSYYCCTTGEVMNAAIPANLKLASETILMFNAESDADFLELDDKAFLIAEAISIQQEITVADVQKILDQKTVYPILKTLLERKIIVLKEELKLKYEPKKVGCVQLVEPFRTDEKFMNDAFEKVARSEKQTRALVAIIQLDKKQPFIRKQDVYNLVDVDLATLKAMNKKGIIEFYDRQVSRLGNYEEETVDAAELSPQQITAIESVNQWFAKKDVVLLHGVTGSGKTRVYVELIQKVIENGNQVLYLLPEIALTTQIIERLQRIFGNQIAVYHSRLNNDERVELWEEVLQGKPILVGPRSAIFLPFKKLDLVIVDEEHDPSFKQNDPAPRYQGRDSAIYLANLHGAKVLLGTATPSIESYYNARKGKYGLVEMKERFGGVKLPKVVVANVKTEMKQRKLQAHFTTLLIDELKGALERGEQAILFQNRRGFAPFYLCRVCDWKASCIHCDVSLTYHKAFNKLRCHYCGYQTKMPDTCPDCGSKELFINGFGTEKIEDDIKIYLPDAKVARLDLDTAKTKNAFTQILNDFEERRVDILIGTQMITKGLDFENVGVVGVLSADQLLQFPDFRASERAFQLMTQVSGRAGRKQKQGMVVIQAMNPDHPVIKMVEEVDFQSLYSMEVQERHRFHYPPFFRLVHITIKHKTPQLLNDAGRLFANHLRLKLGDRVLGPAVPAVSRVRSYFLLSVLVKLEQDMKVIKMAKSEILEAAQIVKEQQGLSGTRIIIDVDPN